jgi:hypothetical protein
MAGLGPAIHVFLRPLQDVDAPHKAGHDEGESHRSDDLSAEAQRAKAEAIHLSACGYGLLRFARNADTFRPGDAGHVKGLRDRLAQPFCFVV